MGNMFEPVRGGEFRRSVEQAGVFGGPDAGYTYGIIHGVDRTVERTALGLYEVVTFPIPPYHPVATKYFSPTAPYPDNYEPGLPADSFYERDSNLEFSGGYVLPFIPGNRFKVFDN
jgi:putative exosortase-associated protein (TIGR04073 family)